MKKKSHEEYVNELKVLNPNIEVLGNYINSKTKIKHRCKVCGYEWLVAPGSLIGGSDCPACKGHRRRTHADYVTELSLIHPNLEVMEQYKGQHKKIQHRCKVCGYTWFIEPVNLQKRKGCPKCENYHKRTHEDYVEELQKINPNIIVMGKFNGTHEKILHKCKVCGYEWNGLPKTILKGYGCPKCARSSTSFMEQYVYIAFCDMIGEDNVIYRDKNVIGKELDIYMPSMKLAIEIGSWKWHADKFENDCKKQELCKNKGIRLITIYDSVFSEHDNSEKEDFYYYNKPLRENESQLIQLIKKISLDYGLNSDLDWENVGKRARLNCRIKTTDEFVDELKEVNPHIRILTEYKTSSKPIKCKCLECGHIWITKPNYLLCGNGCPVCGRKKVSECQKKSNSEYIQNLRNVNPNIEALEEYITTETKLKHRCKICGHEWFVTPHSLLSGSGCPMCGRKRASENRKKSHSEYVDELKNINPNIEVIDTYRGSDIKIKHKCKNCGYEWFVRPISLLRGGGCPECAKKRMHEKQRKTDEQFIHEMKSVNPMIEVLGKYKNNHTKVKCRCKKHNMVWEITPKNLLNGHGCKLCGLEKMKKRNSQN